MKKRNKIFIFIAGVAIGLGLTAAIGLFAFKSYKSLKNPKRFNALELVEKLEGPTIQKDLKVFAASSLDRIFLDGKTLDHPAFSTNVAISAARNEYESFQVVVLSSDKDLSNLRISAADLVNPQSKAVFPAANLSWRKVGYVPTGEPYYPVKYIGLWPDPLMPVETSEAQAGQTQPFWITAYIPENTPAGVYEGTVTVSADGITPQNIPVSLRVYDFTIPQESHLKTAFDLYGHITKLRYPQGEKESDIAWKARMDDINEKFLIEMLKYRMNPILNIDPTVPADLGRIDRYRKFGINNFSIGRKGGTFNNNWPTDEESVNELVGLYRTYAEMLKLNGMLQYTYIYSWDEGEIGNPVVNWVTGMIRRAHPELKNMVCYHGFWDPDKDPEWGKYIDIWTVNVDDFIESAMRKLQKLGIEMWIYISGPSGFSTPQLAIDFDSIDYRIIPWLCWKYDIKGFLYWCVNWWEKSDPFQSAVNTDWGQNGNGLLIYPGEKGPVASLRMEIFRDGMEDYEYIQFLMKKIKELKILKLDSKFSEQINESIRILTVDPTIAESMFNFTKDAEHLKQRRNSIAEKIEEISRLITEANAAPQVTSPIQP